MRYVGIDIFRHFLAIFVIIQHTWSTSRYTEAMYPDYLFLTDIVNGAVWGFFFISGFFARERNNIYLYAKDKFKRLIIPFVLFSIVYGILNIFIWDKGLENIVYSILTLHGTSMQLYFLPYLFIIDLLIVYLLSFLNGRNFYLIWLLFISLVIIVLFLPTLSSTGSEPKLLPFYSLAYTSGILCSKYKNKLIPIIMIFGSFIIGGFLDQRFYDIALMLVMFFILLNLFKNSNLKTFGAGGVYLLHTPFTNFIISIVLLKLGILGWYNFGLTIVLTYLFCMFLTYILIRLASRYRYLLLE